jgi:hypothetical protein
VLFGSLSEGGGARVDYVDGSYHIEVLEKGMQAELSGEVLA